MTLAKFESQYPVKVETSRKYPPKDTERRALASGPIPHLSAQDVERLELAARGLSRKHGEEYALFIRTTFDTALRVNEVLPIRPCDIDLNHGPIVHVNREKGGYPPYAAISPSLATRLLAFAYEGRIDREGRFFSFNDRYAHRLVQKAGTLSGVQKPEGVGWVHLLRHTGGIERLRLTRHLPGVQAQLGHKTPLMTLRYMKTLTQEEALEQSQIGVELAG